MLREITISSVVESDGKDLEKNLYKRCTHLNLLKTIQGFSLG